MKRVIEVKCEKTRKSFYIRVESDTDKITDTTIWTVNGVSAVDEERELEPLLTQRIGNRVLIRLIGQSYPGCPHCGNMSLILCECGKIICFDISRRKVTCPWCNTTSYAAVESSKEIRSCSDGGFDGSR